MTVLHGSWRRLEFGWVLGALIVGTACVRPAPSPSTSAAHGAAPIATASTPATPSPAPRAPQNDERDATAPAPSDAGDGRIVLEEDFPAETRSLKVKALAHVLRTPTDRARYIGKITRGTRVAWKRVVEPDPVEETKRKRKPCPAWVEILPQGYLCRDLLTPSNEPPGGVHQPVVPPRRITPDVYFKIKEDATKVYKTEEDVREDLVEKELSTKVMVVGHAIVDIDGMPFRKTDHGLIDDAALARFWPSDFEGVSLELPGEPKLPFAWIYFDRWGRRPTIFSDPDPKAEKIRKPSRREITSIFEERDGFVRIGPSEWIERKYVKMAARSPAPPGVGPSAQWIDVDLDEQVLVAYKGQTPVYATLVSTGRGRHATPVGNYRVRAKAATTPMAGDPEVPNRYEVSGVPWAVRFAAGFYIHGAYWHDGFGSPRSHGCVNVSPKDAAFVFDWVEPEVPDGWYEVEVPGGEGVHIRVRDRENPNPPAFDYTEEEPWNEPASGGDAR